MGGASDGALANYCSFRSGGKRERVNGKEGPVHASMRQGSGVETPCVAMCRDRHARVSNSFRFEIVADPWNF